jgi:hypothetical protein
MKGSQALVLALAVAAGAYFVFGKGKTDGSGSSGGGSVTSAFPESVVKLAAASPNAFDQNMDGKQSTQQQAYNSAVAGFGSATLNTRESIQAGVDVINTAQAAGIQLPRLSSTISKISQNSNVARLADGSVKVVTVSQPARNSAGQTAMDVQIAKNFAALASKH